MNIATYLINAQEEPKLFVKRKKVGEAQIRVNHLRKMLFKYSKVGHHKLGVQTKSRQRRGSGTRPKHADKLVTKIKKCCTAK